METTMEEKAKGKEKNTKQLAIALTNIVVVQLIRGLYFRSVRQVLW